MLRGGGRSPTWGGKKHDSRQTGGNLIAIIGREKKGQRKRDRTRKGEKGRKKVSLDETLLYRLKKQRSRWGRKGEKASSLHHACSWRGGSSLVPKRGEGVLVRINFVRESSSSFQKGAPQPQLGHEM